MDAEGPDPIRRLVYCFSSEASPFPGEENAGLEDVPGLLERARQYGIEVEEVDFSKRGEEERRALDEQADVAAKRSRSEIHEIFGFRRRGYRPYFGREGPALLVYRGEDGFPAEVYPCRRRGRVMPIRDFLKGLPEAERSFKSIRREDLARLAEIAWEALEGFIRRHPRRGGERERLVEVEWGAPGHVYPVAVRIDAWDRVGLMRDISTLVAEEGVNMTGIRSQEHEDGTITIYVTLETQGLSQLIRLLAKLEGVRGVTAVKRELSPMAR